MEPRDDLTLLPERLLLPRGRSALSEPEVAASQRGRILQAVTEEVARQGYLPTTVHDVTRRARVSRKAFYALYSDKQDAFSAAHVVASQQLLDLVSDAVRPIPASDWRERHRAGILAYLDGFRSAPAYAVSFMVEILSAGPRLLAQREQVMDRYARRTMLVARAAARERTNRPPPSKLAILGSVAAADELVTREIRAGRVDRLADLLDPILEVQLAVIAGQ